MSLSLQRYASRVDHDSTLHFLLKQRSTIERLRSQLLPINKVIDHLPNNLIFEILSWLPVKDLLRFKTVCKSWFSIISSAPFITKHLQNYYNNDDIDWRCCLLVQNSAGHDGFELYQLFVNETPRVLASDRVGYVPFFGSILYGPCDGLYYVCQDKYQCSSHHALWNPTINELHILPDIILKEDFLTHFICLRHGVYGLGLDPITGDRKVVEIKVCYDGEKKDDPVKPVLAVFVYSLRTDSWRYCGQLDECYELMRNKCYIYVNGCCYWLGSYECSWGAIISFDFATDVYEKICVPDYPTDPYRKFQVPHCNHPNTKCLGVYDDSLAFICFHKNEQILDIWTWEKEGSWIKKFTAGPFPDVRDPIGHWNTNWIILQGQNNELMVFDPKTQELKHLRYQTNEMCEGVFAYMESLVSLKDMSMCEMKMKMKMKR